jgi:ribosomal protein S18 acetylase RimI-like enzyme
MVPRVVGARAADLDHRYRPRVPAVDVTTWYLEMTDPAQQAPAPEPDPELTIRPVELPAPELGRALYAGVGADWYWLDRIGWDWARWHERLAREGVELWIPWVRGTPAGYAELERDGDAVEIASFGLLPAFFGRGLGPRLLDAVVRRAWELGPRRVWLHTCSLDGPAALRTYRRRGFEVYDERTDRVTLPDEPPEPWPGANRPRV